MNIQDNKHSTFSTSMGDALASALGQRAPGAPDLFGEDIVNPGAPDLDPELGLIGAPDLEPELGLIDDTLPNILPDDLTPALDEDLGGDTPELMPLAPMPQVQEKLSVVDDAFVTLQPDTMIDTRLVIRLPVVKGENLVKPEGLNSKFIPTKASAAANGERVAMSNDIYNSHGLAVYVMSSLYTTLRTMSAPVNVLPQHVADTLTFMTERYEAGVQQAKARLANAVATGAGVALSDVLDYVDQAVELDVSVLDGEDVKLVSDAPALLVDLVACRKTVVITVTFKQALCSTFNPPRNADDDYVYKYVALRLRELAARIRPSDTVAANFATAEVNVEFLLDTETALRDAFDLSANPGLQALMAEGLGQPQLRGIDNPFIFESYRAGEVPVILTSLSGS